MRSRISQFFAICVAKKATHRSPDGKQACSRSLPACQHGPERPFTSDREHPEPRIHLSNDHAGLDQCQSSLTWNNGIQGRLRLATPDEYKRDRSSAWQQPKQIFAAIRAAAGNEEILQGLQRLHRAIQLRDATGERTREWDHLFRLEPRKGIGPF